MPPGGSEAEWLTRKNRIDTRLRALNPPWQIIPWQPGLDTSKLACHAVTEYPTDHGPADYALFVGGVLLGILEAKKVTVNPQNVLEQAKRYSSGATTCAPTNPRPAPWRPSSPVRHWPSASPSTPSQPPPGCWTRRRTSSR